MISRTEHPNPMLKRDDWENLNGEWDFEFDFGKSGYDKRFFENGEFSKKINVPFCPESKLSGIEYKDFIPAVWYKRTFEVSKDKLESRVIIHFGAVDYESIVFINGKEAGRHIGGYSSFEIDITSYIVEGRNTVIVYAMDDSRSGKQPRGKQSSNYYSNGCDYTRTTGIWQTVWLEYVPYTYIKSLKYYSNIEDGTITIIAGIVNNSKKIEENTFNVKAHLEGKQVGSGNTFIKGNIATLTIKLEEVKLWEVGHGNLYELELQIGEDKVKSYFGLREVQIQGTRIMLNNKPIFQRLVLDQGFYPEGIYTAPSKEDLEKDIDLSMEMGFNGARLHQKMFEPLFLYYCDVKGYLVWGEHANWGMNLSKESALENFLPEWLETIERDFNHPSIITWCPFNETWDYEGNRQKDSILINVYKITKQFDITRPCIDASGWFHVETDIYDLHDYEQNVDVFKGHYDKIDKKEYFEPFTDRQQYNYNKPMIISEYGGIKWDIKGENQNAWGYGDGPKTADEFVERYIKLTDSLIGNSNICGFCYTQLYDVEQEVNGLYTYDRSKKFDKDKIEAIKLVNQKKAAIEIEKDER